MEAGERHTERQLAQKTVNMESPSQVAWVPLLFLFGMLAVFFASAIFAKRWRIREELQEKQAFDALPESERNAIEQRAKEFAAEQAAAREATAPPKYLCTRCGAIGVPVLVTKGTLATEIFLWLFFLLPGIIYSIWRRNSEQSVCPSCGSPELIPPDSPRASAILASVGAKP